MTSVEESSSQGALKMKFKMEENEVELDLESNKNVPSDTPVYMIRNGKVRKTSKKQNFKVLMDKKNFASVLAEEKRLPNGKKHHIFNANFVMNGTNYQMQHMTNDEVARDEQVAPTYAISPVAIEQENLTADGMLRPENKITMDMVNEISQLGWSMDGSKKDYTIQFLLCIDYALYKRWFDASKASTYAERQAEAIRNIQFYFSHVANGIDMRYRSIQDPEFSISAKLVAFYIATTPEASPFTEGSFKELHGEDYYVNADRSLTAFESFFNTYQSSLPANDQATLFTGHKMYNGYDTNGALRRIQGLADIASLCTYRRGTINIDLGFFGSTQTATHEIGHNGAAYHDGSQNSCDSADQFIMANAPGGIDDQNYKNAYTFSHCSIRYIKDYLILMTSNNKNCLANSAEHTTEVTTHLATLPGMLFDANKQCQLIHGPGAYYCSGLKNDAEMCRELTCYVPRLGNCYRASDQRAATGTPCGDNKWCMKSECVYDSRAPAGKDKCLYGDRAGIIQETGKTCKQTIADEPWKCYLERFQDLCCASCGAIYNTSRPQCRYGDKHHICRTITRRDCYDSNRRDECCSTCEKLKGPIQGCEYGDKTSWCKDIFAGSCVVDGDQCCETCPKLKTGDPNCPYGDLDQWCPSIGRLDCYTHKRCCKTCDQFRTHITGNMAKTLIVIQYS